LAAWDEIEKLAYGIHLRAFAARARGDSILLTTFPAEFDRIRSREESFLGALLKKF